MGKIIVLRRRWGFHPENLLHRGEGHVGRVVIDGGLRSPLDEAIPQKDFRIVSSDLPLPVDSDSPFDPTQLASVVLTAFAENGFSDDVRSITAHPAGTVVQLTPEAAASFLAESEEAFRSKDYARFVSLLSP